MGRAVHRIASSCHDREGTPAVQKFAFIVGIGESQISNPPLPTAVADARALHALLVDRDPLVEIDAAWKVKLVLAEYASEREPGSFDDLITQFNAWRGEVQKAQQANEGDLHVMVYFAGHAKADRRTKGAERMPTEVTLQASDGTWKSVEDLFSSVVSLGTRNTTFILDCCHAGQLTEVFKTAMRRQERTDGVTVLAACTNTQKAGSVGMGGEFTNVVLNGLGRDPKVTLGPVTATKLGEYVLDKWDLLPATITEGQKPDIDWSPTARAVPLVTTVGRTRAANPSGEVAPALEGPGGGPLVGPHGEVRVEQAGPQLSVAWIVRPTGASRPWSAPVMLRPGERALAVAALSDRSGAFVLVGGAGETRILQARPAGAASSVVVPGAENCVSGRFGVGRDLGTVVLTSPDGAEQRHDLGRLAAEMSSERVR